VLKRSDLTVRQDFFAELGGDSIGAVQVVELINEKFGTTLGPEMLLEADVMQRYDQAFDEIRRFARESGVAFVAAGHHATERFGVQALGAHLAARFGLEHRFIEVPNPV